MDRAQRGLDVSWVSQMLLRCALIALLHSLSLTSCALPKVLAVQFSAHDRHHSDRGCGGQHRRPGHRGARRHPEHDGEDDVRHSW